MIKKFFVLLLVALGTTLFAQPNPTDNRKVIHVSGSSEMKIIPDEIYFAIELEEYMENKVKVSIGSLEEQLKASVVAAGIESKNLEIEKVYAQGWVRKKRKDDEFIERKTYRLKLSEPSKIDAILDKIDAKGIKKVYIDDYSHSKMEEFKKQLKIEAMKNAKEKARYMLEAINEQLGQAVQVTEIEPQIFKVHKQQYEETDFKSGYSNNWANANSFNAVNFKTMTLHVTVGVDFGIK